MSKKVIIIGGGIAGLSAGCYLRMNGYETEIFEMNATPGGLCTSWKRRDYTIDGCIHWLVGSRPNVNYYDLWCELLDMKSLQFIDFEEYFRVEGKDGKIIRVFTDVDKLEKEFLEKAPEDEMLIREFSGGVRKFLRFQTPVEKAPETYTPLDGLKLAVRFLPYFRAFKKWMSMSLKDYSAKCRNPLLGKVFELMFLPEMAVFFVIMTLAWMHQKSAGYPLGGSLAFARRIEKRYLDLGGKIRYGAKVNRVLVEEDAAVGVLLKNGETHRTDIVLSAADGHATIFEMLEGKYVNEKIKDYYANYEIFPSYIQVSLGVRRTFEGLPHYTGFPLEKPLVLDPETKTEDFGVRIMNFDPTLAPPGKTVLIAMFTTSNYKFWEDLRNRDLERYIAEKKRIADEVVEILERKFGDIKAKVEVADVSTPATVIRYTNNWKGSFEGWLLTPKMGLRQMKKTLPGLRNFYMAGQWVEPGGGIPSGLLSGRNVTQIICKKDGKKFATSKA